MWQQWKRSPRGSRARTRTRAIPERRLGCEELEPRTVPSVSLLAGSDPTQSIASFIDPNGKSIYIPLRATDSAGAAVSFSVANTSPQVSAVLVPASQSLRMSVSGKDSTGAAFAGDLVLRLFPLLAPNTISRIDQLVNQGFYNTSSSQTMIFHRIIPGFVAQGGDPTGTGTGGSGQKINDEFTPISTFTSAGLLAMANSGPDTGDSQFFITDPSVPFSQYPQHLNFRHTIFGQLVSGFDIFSKLITTPTDSASKPLTPVVLQKTQLFTDTQDGVLLVTTPKGVTGSDTITVTATGGGGATATQTFTIVASPDTMDGTASGTPINDRPFLGPVSNQTTSAGTPVTFNLTGTDLQNDPLTFVVKDPTSFAAPANVQVAINGSQVTVTPNAGFTGNVTLLAGVRDQVARNQAPLDDRSQFNTHTFMLTVTPSAATPGIILDPASDTGLFSNDNFTDSTTPAFDVTTDPGKTVQIMVNGAVAATATETSTAGQYKATLKPGALAVGDNTILAQVQGGSALPAIHVTFAPSNQQAYVVPGQGTAGQTLTFRYADREAAFRNEVGFFQVDDATGKIGSLSPGDAGYAQAALSSATRQTLFTTGQTAGATATASIAPGKLLGFYLIQKDTSANFLAANPTDSLTGGPLAFFSFPVANPDNKFSHLRSVTDGILGAVLYRWEDMTGGGDVDFNDAVFTVQAPGTAGTPGEALRIPAGTSQNVKVQVTLQTAQKSGSGTSTGTAGGEVGLFKVDGPDGNIGGIKPGGAGYVAAALGTGRQILFSMADAAGKQATATLAGSALFGFYYIPHGTASGLLASNPSNSATGTPVALFSFAAANPDSDTVHFRLFSPEQVKETLPSSSSILVHAVSALNAGASAFDDLTFAMTMQPAT